VQDRLRLGSVFCIGTISSIADEKEILHRIADPPKKKFSSEIPRKAEIRQRIAQPAPQAKATSYKPKIENLPARRTPLPTSPTKEWTRITRKKEASVPKKGDGAPPSYLSGTFTLKGGRKEALHHNNSLLPRHSLHRGGGEIGIISNLRRRADRARGRTSPA
jgi:hypothetical protein